MITYDGIKSVNERIKKIEVKGKPYACVPARVQAFRELCPGGCIETEIIQLEGGVVTMKSTVKDENGIVLATGMAQEKESSSYINKTSYIENCETSAVGRALGMLGLGSDQQMASAEELANAVFNQSYERPVTNKVNTASNGVYCELCGRGIMDYYANGQLKMTAKEFAKNTKEIYGKELCSDCAKAEKKRRQSE